MGGGPVGAAEEQRHDDGRHGDGVHELGQEEQGEADRGVLGVEAADQLLSASTRSKGGRLSSAVMAIKKKKKGTTPGADDVPAAEKVCGLGVDDRPGATATRR